MTIPSRDDATDLALLRQVAARDRTALAVLYRAYHPRLGRFLSRLTRRSELIEEIINDSFWIVWQKAENFRGESRVSTWLMGIAYRCGLKSVRQDGGIDLSLTELDSELHEHQQAMSDNPSDSRELRDWIAKGLDRLTLEQRLVLELAYVGGHSLEEIAVIMETPVSTVKARMFHARVKLRNLLPVLAERQTPAERLQK